MLETVLPSCDEHSRCDAVEPRRRLPLLVPSSSIQNQVGDLRRSLRQLLP